MCGQMLFGVLFILPGQRRVTYTVCMYVCMNACVYIVQNKNPQWGKNGFNMLLCLCAYVCVLHMFMPISI